MSITAAVSTTKGLRGVAQDFLAPELRALTERIQGFENLNRERFEAMDLRFTEKFKDVDRRFDEVNRRLDQMDRRMDKFDERFAKIDERLAKMSEDIANIPNTIGIHIDRLIQSMNVSNRLAALESGLKLPSPL